MLLPTEIKLGVLLRYFDRLALKSSLPILHQLHVGTRVMNPDYTGEIMVWMINTTPRVYSFKKGDHIVRLILERVLIPILMVMKELPPTITEAQGCGFCDIYIYLLKLVL